MSFLRGDAKSYVQLAVIRLFLRYKMCNKIEPKLYKCKYSNCVHINEPNCEIKKLVSSGLILSSRYKNYCSMFRSEDIYR